MKKIVLKVSLVFEINLYCLIGNPIRHSLSPIIHNLLFDYFDCDAVYLSFSINDMFSIISGIKEFEIKGCSITAPYKVLIMGYLNKVDSNAIEIGSVNTIINSNEYLLGFNFDYNGIVIALFENINIVNKKILLIGAGGVGKAVGYGVKKHGGILKITNRNIKKGKKLADCFDAIFCNVSEIDQNEVDILINGTSIGMGCMSEIMPIPEGFISSNMMVMDLIYYPFETVLLKKAKDIDCKTINGLSVFLYQGIYQFEFWTGLKPPKQIVKNFFEDCLKKNFR